MRRPEKQNATQDSTAGFECRSCDFEAETETELLEHVDATDDEAHADERARVADAPQLEAVVETLVENGVIFVAAQIDSLENEPLRLQFHLPAIVGDEQRDAVETYLAEDIGFDPHPDGSLGVVRIGDRPTPTATTHVFPGGLHLYRRVPLYVVDGIPGLDAVPIEEGLEGAHEVASGDRPIPTRESRTADLAEVVAELADAGAASVELEHEAFQFVPPKISLRIPMVPAKGKPIVGPIEAVNVNGETFPLKTRLTMDGPTGSHGRRTALYVSDNVEGLAPVSVEDGMEAGRALVARAEDADTMMDLQPPRDEREPTHDDRGQRSAGGDA